MKNFLALVLSLILFLTTYAQTVIKGQEKSYANLTLKLYSFDDRITFTPTLLDSCQADSAGSFVFSFTSSSVKQVFIDLQTYHGAFLTEPDKTYIVSLTPYKPLSLEQLLNPYFTPKNLLLPLQNIDSNDINWKVRFFDHFYKIFRNQLVIRHVSNPDTVEYAISLLDKNSPHDTSSFYLNYKKYRYASLRLATYMKDLWIFADKYFLHAEPHLDNPAYMSLFNSVFDNCLSPLKNFFPSTSFLLTLRAHNFITLVNSFMTLGTNTNRHTAELIMLKGLYDLFYDYKPAQELIIQTIDDARHTLADSALRLIAQNIYDNITALLVGYSAPEFSLPSRMGLKKSLKNFSGKFVYLNFCHPQSLECQSQFDLLERYTQTAPKDLEIVTILYGLDKKQFRKFLKEHKQYKWTFLNGQENSRLLHQYKVVAFPTYYLIDPDGKLLLSPAPMPTENFEQIFTELYKKWYKEHKQPHSIHANH